MAYNPDMQDEIVTHLLRLNQQFYQIFAEDFAETRGRLQPGVMQAMNNIPRDASVLDLGCGNGEVLRELTRGQHQGTYLGLDLSPGLLSIARQKCEHPRARFHLADLANPSWVEKLPTPSEKYTEWSYDRILAFAVLHHIPGAALRLSLTRQVHDRLTDDGQFMLSNWNFMASPRLRARIVPWDAIELDQSDVDPGDHLLDWRRGGHGLRYVHQFDEDELGDLAVAAGFSVVETTYSDGEGGRLGLYQVWEKS
jgi:SAM-dependent methyltransferase